MGHHNTTTTTTTTAITMSTDSKSIPNFNVLVENYSRKIIEEMDLKTLEQFAFDTLVSNLTNDYETTEDLIDAIKSDYDDEFLSELIA